MGNHREQERDQAERNITALDDRQINLRRDWPTNTDDCHPCPKANCGIKANAEENAPIEDHACDR
jgi:hypothetical protein